MRAGDQLSERGNLTVRGRIESGFSRWGYFVVRMRWLMLVGVLGLTTGLASWLPELRVDNSEDAFLHADDPERQRYDAFRDRYGEDNDLVLLVHPPEIYDLGFLETLRALHHDLDAEVPYLDDIKSLVNARYTHGRADELIVEELLADENWPQAAEDLVALRERVESNPLYTNVLVSEDGAYTALSLRPYLYSTLGPEGEELAGFEETGAAGPVAEPKHLSEEEENAFVEATLRVVERYEAPEFRIHLIGGPAMGYRLAQLMNRDIQTFMTLSILVTAMILYLLFRRLSGVLLPLVVVLTSLLSSMGLMVVLDIPMSITIQMLPGFLIVVGVCDAVHILTIVYQRLEAGDRRDDAIAFALGHSGLAVVMTSVTTAMGLLSFSLAELLPIAQLGTIAPIGVMLAMFYTLTLLPALLAIFPLRADAGKRGSALRGGLSRRLAAVGDLATRYPVRVLAASAAVLLLAGAGFARVHFSHDGIRWFPQEDPLRIAKNVLDEHFKGGSAVEVIVYAGRENGLHEPDTLRRIERAMRHAETLKVAGRPVSKAVSLVDVVKETHQALNENRREYYVLPQDRALIAQELLLFENSGSDDLEEITDSRFSEARVTVRTPWVDAMLYPAFLERLTRDLREILGEALPFELTGGVVMFTGIFNAVIISMARSYLFALGVILPLLVLLVGSLRRGLAAMIPNLIPVYLVLCLMGALDIPLDASTLLMGGVVIGLAVDDTIHFMHQFNRYYELTGDPRAAVHQTLATTGSALLFTSLVLSLGFCVFLFAYMRNSVWFGLLGSFAAAVAFLADVLVAPALMVLVTRRRTASGETLGTGDAALASLPASPARG